MLRSGRRQQGKQCRFMRRGVRCTFVWKHDGLCSFDASGRSPGKKPRTSGCTRHPRDAAPSRDSAAPGGSGAEGLAREPNGRASRKKDATGRYARLEHVAEEVQGYRLRLSWSSSSGYKGVTQATSLQHSPSPSSPNSEWLFPSTFFLCSRPDLNQTKPN